MFKSLCVTFLAFSSLALADDFPLPKEINPTDYLVFFNIRRALMDHRHVLEGNVDSTAAEKARTYEDLQRHIILEKKGATTPETLYEAQMVYAIAVADYEQAQHQLDFNRAENDLLEVRIAFSTGEPEDVRRLYPIYKRQWDADCRIKETEFKMAQAKATFHELRAQMIRKLMPSGAATLAEYQRAEVKTVQASNFQKAKQSIWHDCDKGLPTLEELVKLQEQEVAPPTPPKLPGVRRLPPR